MNMLILDDFIKMDINSFSENFKCKIFEDIYCFMQNNLTNFSKNPL